MSSGVLPDRRGRACGQGGRVGVQPGACLFHLHGLGERSVTLQADNCTRQNKNTTMADAVVHGLEGDNWSARQDSAELHATWAYQVLAGLLFWALQEALPMTESHR